MIHVIHVRDADFSDPRTVYIGRRHNRRGLELPESPLANPFKVRNESHRTLALSQFREHFMYTARRIPIVELNRLIGLARSGDLRLACWCAPKACHGDVIKEWIESLIRGT